MTARRSRLLLLCAVVVAAAGAVDAAFGGEWDQLAIVLFVIALILASFVVGHSRRPTVTVRADLARWLHDRSVVEGEDLDALVDRAIATYREQLDVGAVSRD